jgi:multidrug efflux system membrane fusion protein
VWILIAVTLVGGGAAYWWHGRSPPQAAARRPAAVPVTVVTPKVQDVPIFLDALGTISAMNTVAVHSQIDGMLQSVNFTEGQEVKKGDVLAVLDPRPLQAMLEQALAKQAQDEAQLVAAEKDLARTQDLAKRAVATQQNLDQQQAKVDQLKATIDADRGAIDSARTQLSYATITAPFDGVVGFRQLDPGNVIHANDQNPLTVLTQIQPALAIFTLPQKNLTEVREAMLRGEVKVLAFDQDNAHQLAEGQLLLVDNQIDQTTSTMRLKARFANNDRRLWPGEFVRVRVLVSVIDGAVTVPAAAVQRGPQGVFAWVVKPDGTADQRPLDVRLVNNLAVVRHGISENDQVVVNGQYRLEAGARVEIRNDQAAAITEKAL